MHSIAFSLSNLTLDEAGLIADAFFRGGQDPSKMAQLLRVDSFDLNLFTHPYVKKEIVARRVQLNETYTLAEHIASLKKIRDAALDNENLKIALPAEVALGKAAGLYLPKPVDVNDPMIGGDPTRLSTEELRQRLARATNILTAPVDDQPADPSIDFDDDEI